VRARALNFYRLHLKPSFPILWKERRGGRRYPLLWKNDLPHRRLEKGGKRKEKKRGKKKARGRLSCHGAGLRSFLNVMPHKEKKKKGGEKGRGKKEKGRKSSADAYAGKSFAYNLLGDYYDIPEEREKRGKQEESAPGLDPALSSAHSSLSFLRGGGKGEKGKKEEGKRGSESMNRNPISHTQPHLK